MACTASKTPLFRSIVSRGYSVQAATKARHVGEVHSTTLPNKMTVASVETDSPISRVSILFRAGARNETSENCGASHAIRIAAGASTGNATSFGITRNLQQIGGSLSCTSDREIFAYTVDVTRDHLDTALSMLQNAVTHQVFKPWELEDSIPRIKGDLARISDPIRAVELLHKAAFRSGLGNSIFMPDYQVGKQSSESLQHYFQTNFTTNRAAVVGVGVDHQLLIGYAQCLPLESGAGNDTPSTYNGLGEIRLEKGGRHAHIAVATQGAALKNTKEAIAFAVLQAAAGFGPAAKRGDSQGVFAKAIASACPSAAVKALNVSYSDNGLFGFVVSAEAKAAGKVVEAGVKALRSGSVSSEDVARGKAILKAAVLYNSESGCGLIEDLGGQAIHFGSVQNTHACLAEIDSITASDVSSAAKKAASGKLSVGAVGNLESVPYINHLN